MNGDPPLRVGPFGRYVIFSGSTTLLTTIWMLFIKPLERISGEKALPYVIVFLVAISVVATMVVYDRCPKRSKPKLHFPLLVQSIIKRLSNLLGMIIGLFLRHLVSLKVKRENGLKRGYSLALLLALLPVTSCVRKIEATNSCYGNLTSIAGAKEMWAADNHATNGVLVTQKDLLPLLRTFPKCSKGGMYRIGRVGELPACSLPEHKFP